MHLSTPKNISGIENIYWTIYRNRHRNRGKFWNHPITSPDYGTTWSDGLWLTYAARRRPASTTSFQISKEVLQGSGIYHSFYNHFVFNKFNYCPVTETRTQSPIPTTSKCWPCSQKYWGWSEGKPWSYISKRGGPTGSNLPFLLISPKWHYSCQTPTCPGSTLRPKCKSVMKWQLWIDALKSWASCATPTSLSVPTSMIPLSGHNLRKRVLWKP